MIFLNRFVFYKMSIFENAFKAIETSVMTLYIHIYIYIYVYIQKTLHLHM
jgi:hypothetical protein